MKRFSKIFMAVFILGSIFLGTACGGSVELSYSFPWLDKYEYAKYNVVICSGSLADSEEGFADTVLGRGFLEYELTYDDEQKQYTLSESYEMVFDKNVPDTLGDDTGKTDRMTSYAVFKESFAPLKSHKEFICDNRLRDDGTPYDNYSYTVDAEYGEKNVSVSLVFDSYKMKDGVQHSVSASTKHQSALDNNTLFYAVRGISDLELDFSGNFKLFNAFDYGNEKRSPHSMSVSVDSDPSLISLPAAAYKKYISAASTEESPQIDALKATMSIVGDRSGTSLIAYYATTPFNAGQSSASDNLIHKVLLRFETLTYLSAKISTQTIYTLAEYNHVAG